jgi:beta-glucosidase
LKKGESKQITVSLDKSLLRYWDENKGEFVTPSGEYQIFVGASSSDIRLNGTVQL